MGARDFRTYVRETVTITRPLPSSYERGRNAPVQNLPAVSVRLPEAYREPIEEAAELLGVTRSEFLRWCAYHVALDILKQHEAFKKLK